MLTARRRLRFTFAVLAVAATLFAVVRYRTTGRDVVGAPPLPDFVLTEPAGEFVRALVVGDTGTGDWRQRRVSEGMRALAAGTRIDLVLHTGDLFYKDGVRSVDDPQWEEKIEGPFGGALADVPIRPVLGNHDHLGNVDAILEYGERSERWRMPALHYSFVRGEAEFFALDTTRMIVDPEELAERVAWLDDALGRSTARWKVVFGHHPIYSGGREFTDSAALIRELEPVLDRHGVDLYLAGHDHYLGLLLPDSGVAYAISGAGAKPRSAEWTDETAYAYADLGFATLTIERDALELRFHDARGEVLFAHRLVAADA